MADATRAVIDQGIGIGIIENDDGLTISIDDVALVEGATGSTTQFQFTITATDTSSRDIEVTVST